MTDVASLTPFGKARLRGMDGGIPAGCVRCRELEAQIAELKVKLQGRTETRRAYWRSQPFVAQSKRRQVARNASLAEKAARHRQPWTGPELELASRQDLTIAEIATVLNRTYDAVRRMRRKLEDPLDPRRRQLRDGPPPTSVS